MLKNYFRLALRNFERHRSYSIINITGLAVGVTCCLLILLFVRHELSYDRFNENSEQIYRVTYQAPNDMHLARTPPPLGPRLAETYPEIRKQARLFGRNVSIAIEKDGEELQLEEENIFFADSSITSIFTFETLAGNLTNALNLPNQAIITRSASVKYFGSTDVIGNTIMFEGNQPFQVMAVTEDLPPNSHWHFNILVPYENMYDLAEPAVAEMMRQNLAVNWVISHSYTYLLLQPGADPAKIEAGIPDLLNKHAKDPFKVGQVFNLQPLADIHLKSNLGAELEPVGSISTLYIFGGVALITLIIACINFINLSINQYHNRLKEVGVRKVLGAVRGQLFWQFIGESLLLVLMAVIIGFVLSSFLIPQLNQLTDKSFSAADLFDPWIAVSVVLLVTLLGLLAGGYPAIYVSAFKPVASLRNMNISGKAGKLNLRRALVIIQFTFSIGLIASSIIIYHQLNLLKNQPLGFPKEQLIVMPLFSENMNNIFGGVNAELRQKMNVFEDQLLQNANIQSVTASSVVPGSGAVNRGVVPEGFIREDNLFVASMAVDYDFAETFDLEILAGRDFSKEAGADHLSSFIINEAAVDLFEWGEPADAIGKSIDLEGKKGQVIGVMKNIIFQPLYEQAGALVLDVNPPLFTAFSAKVNSTNIQETISYAESIWKGIFPKKVFEYTFLDQQLKQIYLPEQKFGYMISLFAGLAIFISCLGSFGLIAYTASQRTKEIGIRKVMGASVSSILRLLTSEFSLLVGIAFLLAVPATWYLMNDWLANFAYQVEISIWILLMALAVSFFIVWVSVSFQVIKAAAMNPVKALRDD